MQNLLITGGAGFIGSNFIPYYLAHNPEVHIINIDALTYAGSLDHLTEVEHHERYTFIKGDISDRGLIENLFEQYDIRGVIHFAGESHVDQSITNPEIFIRTNIIGTFNVIDVARHHWIAAPGRYKEAYKACRFHHISTDEVYGSLGQEGQFTETTAYAPNNPYSASKASSDFIVRSYHNTYGIDVVTTHGSNNYGPKQHEEKFIPLVIHKALAEAPITLHGDGTHVRDWLYVLDHCKGIALAYEKGTSGEIYNIGGRNERTILHMAQMVCDRLDIVHPRADKRSYRELITFIEDRPGNDLRYAVDATKIRTELGWHPTEDLEVGIQKTINWYLKKLNPQQTEHTSGNLAGDL